MANCFKLLPAGSVRSPDSAAAGALNAAAAAIAATARSARMMGLFPFDRLLQASD
jgi:hypothetical protein